MFTRGSSSFERVSRGYTFISDDKRSPQRYYYELYHSTLTMSYVLYIYLDKPCTYSFRTCAYYDGWKYAGRRLYRNVDISEARRKRVSPFELLDVNACVNKWVQGLRIWIEDVKY